MALSDKQALADTIVEHLRAALTTALEFAELYPEQSETPKSGCMMYRVRMRDSAGRSFYIEAGREPEE